MHLLFLDGAGLKSGDGMADSQVEARWLVLGDAAIRGVDRVIKGFADAARHGHIDVWNTTNCRRHRTAENHARNVRTIQTEYCEIWVLYA